MNLLHKSKYFAIYQCDADRCFHFETQNKSVALTLCQLLNLRNKVLQIDLGTHFDEDLNPSGIEILTFCNCEHLLILDTYQVIDIKHFIEESFARLVHSSSEMDHVATNHAA